MKTFAFIAAFGAALAVAGAAQAEEAPRRGGGHHFLMGADSNNDGQITKAEAEAHRAAMFTRMDADGDGYLTAADREARRAARAAQRAERMAQRAANGQAPRSPDANGDGRVSREEFLARGLPGFERIDANNNDVLEASEIAAARQAMQERRAQRRQSQTQHQE